MDEQPETTRAIKDYCCSQCFGFYPSFGVEIQIETQRLGTSKVVLTLWVQRFKTVLHVDPKYVAASLTVLSWGEELMPPHNVVIFNVNREDMWGSKREEFQEWCTDIRTAQVCIMQYVECDRYKYLTPCSLVPDPWAGDIPPLLKSSIRYP
jgi:hypothetical protein